MKICVWERAPDSTDVGLERTLVGGCILQAPASSKGIARHLLLRADWEKRQAVGAATLPPASTLLAELPLAEAAAAAPFELLPPTRLALRPGRARRLPRPCSSRLRRYASLMSPVTYLPAVSGRAGRRLQVGAGQRRRAGGRAGRQAGSRTGRKAGKRGWQWQGG